MRTTLRCTGLLAIALLTAFAARADESSYTEKYRSITSYPVGDAPDRPAPRRQPGDTLKSAPPPGRSVETPGAALQRPEASGVRGQDPKRRHDRYLNTGPTAVDTPGSKRYGRERIGPDGPARPHSTPAQPRSAPGHPAVR